MYQAGVPFTVSERDYRQCKDLVSQTLSSQQASDFYLTPLCLYRLEDKARLSQRVDELLRELDNLRQTAPSLSSAEGNIEVRNPNTLTQPHDSSRSNVAEHSPTILPLDQSHSRVANVLLQATEPDRAGLQNEGTLVVKSDGRTRYMGSAVSSQWFRRVSV